MDRLRAISSAILLLVLCCSATGHAQDEDRGAIDLDLDAGGSESPWLLTPLLSVDPKLGRNVGALGAYTLRFDEDSPASMIGAAVTYSSTDSYVGGLFADLYWQGDRNRLSMGAGFG